MGIDLEIRDGESVMGASQCGVTARLLQSLQKCEREGGCVLRELQMDWLSWRMGKPTCVPTRKSLKDKHLELQ